MPEPVLLSCRVDRYCKNPRGRDLIVGDIHGHFTRLTRVLEASAFDAASDRLFCVGDLIDRGPESLQAEKWLLQPWFRTVIGNHEADALEWIAGALGDEAYGSQGGQWLMEADVPTQLRLAALLRPLPVAIEIETTAGVVAIVHADCPRSSWKTFRTHLAMEIGQADQSTANAALMSRRRVNGRSMDPVAGILAVVVGHTPVSEVLWMDNVVAIDTEGWGHGHFTVLDAETLRPALGAMKGAG